MSFLGNSLEAHHSVVTAIACFTVSRGAFEPAVSRAIGLGNDTDTLAAMAGALSGACLGKAALPAHPLAKLEETPKGRSYIERLAARLHDRYLSRRDQGSP